MFAFCPLHGEGSYGERITSPLHPLSAYCAGNVYSLPIPAPAQAVVLLTAILYSSVNYAYCSEIYTTPSGIRSPPFSSFSSTLPPLGPTPSEGLVPVTMVSPWCRARTRYSVILSWASKQQQVHVKTVTGVLGPAGFVVLEQHGRMTPLPDSGRCGNKCANTMARKPRGRLQTQLRRRVQHFTFRR